MKEYNKVNIPHIKTLRKLVMLQMRQEVLKRVWGARVL